MPPFHSRRILPIPENTHSQRQYIVAAAAAKHRQLTYKNELRKQEEQAIKINLEKKKQKQIARRDPTITLPRDPVKVAKKRVAKAFARVKEMQRRESGRGIRWYDGKENLVRDGALLAKERSKAKSKTLMEEEEKKKQKMLADRRRIIVNKQNVLMEAKEILLGLSEEFEKGSFHLLKADGTLHRSVRKQVLKSAFGNGILVDEETEKWVPGGNTQKSYITRGTKRIPAILFKSGDGNNVSDWGTLGSSSSSSAPLPIGYGGTVRLFSV